MRQCLQTIYLNFFVQHACIFIHNLSYAPSLACPLAHAYNVEKAWGICYSERTHNLHELSLTQRIVKIVCSEAKKENASRVLKVTLAVGEDSGIVPDCVTTYFDLLAEGTIAQGAKIEANIICSTLYCENCKKEFERARFSFSCPNCGAEGTPTGKGNECYVESIEIDI